MDPKPGKQEITKEMEEQTKELDTFNPLFHNGEFLGPNAVRYENHHDREAHAKECEK